MFELLRPTSVVDVGCGTGQWLAEVVREGVPDVLGLDGSWVNENELAIPRTSFLQSDLTREFKVDRRFDLVMSLEVAEHLPPAAAEGFVRGLTRLGSVVLFSAAIPYQGGEHHLNERWPSYWCGLFEREGFMCLDCLRPKLWAMQDVEYWYAQNVFLAVEPAGLARCPALREAATSGAPVRDLVHPRLYLQSAARAKSTKELLHVVLGAFRDRLLGRSRGVSTQP